MFDSRVGIPKRELTTVRPLIAGTAVVALTSVSSMLALRLRRRERGRPASRTTVVLVILFFAVFYGITAVLLP
jgi:hypothetical protein